MTIAPTSPAGSWARPKAAVPASGTSTSARPIETEYRPRPPVDVRRTVLYQRHGGGDPTMVVAGEVIWRASRTPEVFVLDAGHRLVYRGAPDSDHRDPDGAEPYLRPALAAALAGARPEVQETPTVGCTIKWR